MINGHLRISKQKPPEPAAVKLHFVAEEWMSETVQKFPQFRPVTHASFERHLSLWWPWFWLRKFGRWGEQVLKKIRKKPSSPTSGCQTCHENLLNDCLSSKNVDWCWTVEGICAPLRSSSYVQYVYYVYRFIRLIVSMYVCTTWIIHENVKVESVYMCSDGVV